MPRTEKILVAYDGSDCANAALNDIRHAGLDTKAQARVITVSDPWIPPIEAMSVATDVVFAGAYALTRANMKESLREARALAEKGAARLRGNFPGWTVSSLAAIDAPAQGILDAAEKWKPSLIVMGSRGHTTLGRLLLGSVSHKVLTHATCNVRIARPGSARISVPRVLLAVDGSKDADAMVKYVANRSWDKDAEFRIVVVLDYRLSLIQDFETGITAKGRIKGVPSRSRLAERIAEQAEYALADRGFKATAAIREGDPRREIGREVRRFKANSLFLGSRGLHAVQRFLLGSVSSALAEHAPCAVEIVRR
jgi:nucleotide-binding universal stress UspA family protein